MSNELVVSGILPMKQILFLIDEMNLIIFFFPQTPNISRATFVSLIILWNLLMSNNFLVLSILTIIQSGIYIHIFKYVIVAHNIFLLILIEFDLKVSLTIRILLKSLPIIINQFANGDASQKSSLKMGYVNPSGNSSGWEPN